MLETIGAIVVIYVALCLLPLALLLFAKMVGLAFRCLPIIGFFVFDGLALLILRSPEGKEGPLLWVGIALGVTAFGLLFWPEPPAKEELPQSPPPVTDDHSSDT